MFGYVKVAKGELRVREYEYYRASYCGLCRAMGQCTGQCSRMLLNYDFAFMANVRMALEGETPTFKKKRCMAHPLRARYTVEPTAALRYCAAASVVLAFEKCRDDLADERGFSRVAAWLKCLLLRRAYRRAARQCEELPEAVREHLLKLRQLEEEKRPSVDEVAEVFGNMMAYIMSFGLEGNTARIAAKIGYCTGRFVYIADAADDCERDEKNGSYNPFLLMYGHLPTVEEKKDIEGALMIGLADLEAAMDLIDEAQCNERRAVLQNILYLGLPRVAKHVLFGEEKDSKEKKDE